MYVYVVDVLHILTICIIYNLGTAARAEQTLYTGIKKSVLG